ncbi:MAG: diacylglycerol kinase family protein [Candidatus Doudnabacteria bacterium]
MYYYIVDPQKISQREFERVQNLLYSSLSEFRVSGEVMRSTGLRTINQLVENAFSHGAKTIVAVGSDDTLHDVINAIKSREMTVGFIPIFETEIGEMLGLKNIEQSAKTIGLRRLAEFDLGSVNGNYFLSKLTFGLGTKTNAGLFNFKLIQSLFTLPIFEVKFSVNGRYQASTKVVSGIITINRNAEAEAEVMLLPKLSRAKTFRYRKQILSGDYRQISEASIIQANKIEVSVPAGLPLRVGGRVIAKTPATIEILPKALKLIVSRDRKL